MATQSDTVVPGAGADDAVFGLSANIAAAIGYVLPIVALIFLLVEEEGNEFLRFNAAQAVAFGFGLFVIRFGVGLVIGFLPGILATLAGLVMSLLNLVIFGAFLFLAYKAYSEETVELPVFADIARSIEDAL
ncbi:DUF4870 domain-containing protein [Halomicroarcula sp. GCM10025709]|uniref:DUF4870 domain-containing protein n=1 Tax=Haloarcula TaxID=2237 RepID=UPI0024C3C444|nr:DUF4870 domain-containing protein [Halomicroarcula sp. YJ-61-S]